MTSRPPEFPIDGDQGSSGNISSRDGGQNLETEPRGNIAGLMKLSDNEKLAGFGQTPTGGEDEDIEKYVSYNAECSKRLG